MHSRFYDSLCQTVEKATSFNEIAHLCAPSGGLDFQFGTKYTIGKRKSI